MPMKIGGSIYNLDRIQGQVGKVKKNTQIDLKYTSGKENE